MASKSRTTVLLMTVIGTLVGHSLFAAGTTSETVNPFNEFMTPKGGVNMVSGQVAFPYTLYTLRSANGMTRPLTLSYSSNIELNVKARNDVSPTTWVGLGWTFGFGAIKVDHNGTVDKTDDSYEWISDEGISERIIVQYRVGANTTPKYYLEKHPYMKVTPFDNDNDGIIDGWQIIDEAGKRYTYGNCPGVPTTNNTVRYTYCWKDKNYVGVGFSGTPTPFPYQWDIAAVEDPYGNGFRFEYDQSGDAQEDVQITNTDKPTWKSPFKYTKASYLKKIVSSTGEYAEFTTVTKDENEWRDPRTAKPEPDGFIEFFEKRLLDKIVVKNANDELVRSYQFCYKKINTFLSDRNDINDMASWLEAYRALDSEKKKYTKSVLLSITENDAADKEHKRVIFSHFDGFDYNQSMLTNAAANKSDYYFGAMKSIRYPQCGEVSFVYNRKEMTVKPKFDEKIDAGSSVVWGNLPNGREYAIIQSNGTNTSSNVYVWTGSEWTKKLSLFEGGNAVGAQYIPGRSGFFKKWIRTGYTEPRDQWVCGGDWHRYECRYISNYSQDAYYTDIGFWYWDENTQNFKQADAISNDCLNGNCSSGIQSIPQLNLVLTTSL
jgi:hypothetical protein